ncbi:hypothetical protein ACFWMQ_28295 [Streptomyces sp. NPDC058372]|uniref:hypothetical protein n=1 Tax=unclassified Streptomyces TaxID=2593676 RepID=UPI003657CDD4
MGWTVLYIAFGIVALWLLGEVLLQYKARLRWRLLAFAGFSCVVLGVLMSLVVVIALGAMAFAVGQTFVTLSFRRGFSTGWAVGGRPGESRRRRTKQPGQQDPTLEVSGLQEETPDVPDAPDAPPVYAPVEPMPDDTGRYGVYDDGPDPRRDEPAQDSSGYEAPYVAQESGYAPQDPYAAAQAGYDYDYAAQSYGYDTGQGQYTGHADPYAATAGYDHTAQSGYGDWNGQQSQESYGYPQETYTTTGYTDTPPGGVWVPQQRDGESGYGGYGYDASGLPPQHQPDGSYVPQQGYEQWGPEYGGLPPEQTPAQEQGTPDHGGQQYRY